MEISLRRGLLEAGLTACISSFCLSPIAAWSQTDAETDLAASQESVALDWAAAQRIEAQQQALLSAVERIHDQSQVALDRYTETILTQFQGLQESFASQRTELTTLEQINASTRSMLQVMMVIALASLAVLAWIPLWATSRMTKRILGMARQRASLIHTSKTEEFDVVDVPCLESALQRLEERLLALEHLPTSAAAAESIQPSATPVTALRRATDSPRVALRMGEGSALFFVPHEIPGHKMNAFRRHWARVKKLLSRSPATQRT